MKLPTYEELAKVEEQLDVLEYPLDKSLFVVGPPGSGKTVLAERRARMVAELVIKKSDVVVVTYNRMLRRLFDVLSKSGVCARTMHSFIWHDYQKRTGENPPLDPPDSFVYQWEAMLEQLATNDHVVPNISHLIVDEGQDLPQGFFEYGFRYVSQILSVFADENQALSDQFSTMEQIKHAASLENPIILRHNHRNTPEIARLAEHFHGGQLPVADVRRSHGDIPRLVKSPGIDSTAKMVSNWFKTRSGNVGVIVNQNQSGQVYFDKLCSILPNVRVDFYSNNRKNEDQINIVSPGITVMNQKSVKGQEFDTVFILELDRFIPCASETARRTMYMMCARARDNLFLVYGPGDLSTKAAECLPGQDILEQT